MDQREFFDRAGSAISRFSAAFSRAGLELIMTFYPLLVLGLVYGIFDSFDRLAEGPDMMLVSAVLFAEGWWKLRENNGIKPADKEILFMIGFLGAIAATLLAAIIAMDHLGVIAHGVFGRNGGKTLSTVGLVLWCIAPIFAILIRIKK